MRRRLQHNKTYWTTLASKVKDQYHMLKPKRKDWRTEELFELTIKNEETGQLFGAKYRIYMKTHNILKVLLYYFIRLSECTKKDIRLYLKQVRNRNTHVYKNTPDAKLNWELLKIEPEVITKLTFYKFTTTDATITWKACAS